MAAPLGNKYAIGNTGGRPRMYETPDEMASQVDAYFVYCEGEYELKTKIDDEGKKCEVKEWIRVPEPYTITGLALFLGFSCRQSLDDYEKKEEFTGVIKRARARVENGYEQRLYGNNPTGAIFALKNMGWKDKTENDSNVNMGITWKEEKVYAP